MTNEELYAKELSQYKNAHPAMEKSTHTLLDCANFDCRQCYFFCHNYVVIQKSCTENFKHWLKQKAKEEQKEHMLANKQKYAKEIANYNIIEPNFTGTFFLHKKTKTIKACYKANCNECLFNHKNYPYGLLRCSCRVRFEDWLNRAADEDTTT